MSVKAAWRRSAFYQYTCFHIFLHRVSSEVCAGNEAKMLIGDGHLCVNPATVEASLFVHPRVDPQGGNGGFHLRKSIYRNGTAVLVARFQQHRNFYTLAYGTLKCLHYGADVVSDEACHEEPAFGRLDHLKKR